MRKYLILLLILQVSGKINSQVIKLYKNNIGLDFGIVKYSMNDKLLNYYKYNSTKFSIINVHYNFLGEKNIHFLKLNFNSAKLSTTQASYLFRYNNIELIDLRLNYEYYHKLKSFKSKINFYIGCSLSILETVINQSYQSIYWWKVNQYSYDFSGNYSVNTLIQYQRQKGCFMVKIGYSLINYTSRPDDYYIKYGYQLDNQEWKWNSINNYQNVPFSLIYHFDISNHFSIQFEYLSEFRRYIINNEFKFLKQSWLMGLSFKF